MVQEQLHNTVRGTIQYDSMHIAWNGDVVPVSYTHLRNNALTLYTSSFGESTNTNEFGYEVTVSNGKVLKVGNGNSALGDNQFVLSAHGEACLLYTSRCV